MFIGTSVSYVTYIRNTLYNYYIITILTVMNGSMIFSLMLEIINFLWDRVSCTQVGFELTMQPRMVSDSEYPSSTSQALGLQLYPSTPSSCGVGNRTQCSMSAWQMLYTLSQVSTPTLIDIFINILTYCKYMLYIPYYIYKYICSCWIISG